MQIFRMTRTILCGRNCQIVLEFRDGLGLGIISKMIIGKEVSLGLARLLE